MRSSYEWEQDIIDCLSGSSYENPMPVRDIAEIIGMTESHPTCPRTRELILKAMVDFDVAYGANNKGYYKISNKHEMQRYMNLLLDKQIAISKRIEIVYNAFNRAN